MKLTCPLYLVHGIPDLTVPPEHSKAIHDAAAGPKKLDTVISVTLVPILEDWIANKLEELATKGLPTSAAPE
jgi:fermentation-respiration switch protein FrsA (DUF1100 family)